MTVDKVEDQKATVPEKPPVTVQNEIQKEVLKQTMEGDNTQQQLLQLLAMLQPQQHIQRTAQDQLEKGYLDIKV